MSKEWIALSVFGALTLGCVGFLFYALLVILAEVLKFRQNRAEQMRVQKIILGLQSSRSAKGALEEAIKRLDSDAPRLVPISTLKEKVRIGASQIIEQLAANDDAKWSKMYGVKKDAVSIAEIESIRDLIQTSAYVSGVSDHLADALEDVRIALEAGEPKSGLNSLENLARNIAKLEQDVRDRTTERNINRRYFRLTLWPAIVFGLITVAAAADQFKIWERVGTWFA